MAEAKKDTTQEVVFNSDSDSSSSCSECCSCVDEIHVYEQELMEESSSFLPKLLASSSIANPVQANKPLVSFVVKPIKNIMKEVDGHVLCDNVVMSLNDLDQYDIMLQGLINELSTISDKLVS